MSKDFEFPKQPGSKPGPKSGPKTGTTDGGRVAVFIVNSKGAGGFTGERAYRFQKNRLVIGSVESADVRVVGDGVSPIHAVVEVDEAGSATVFDLASETGVFVNGTKTVTQVIKPGDVITVGLYTLRFDVEDASKSEDTGRVRRAGTRNVFWDPHEDLAPLLLQDELEVDDIFDFQPTSKTALEIVMSWHGSILEVQHFTDQRLVTIGNDRRVDFGIPPVLSAARFPLVSRQGETYFLNLDTQMSGIMQRQGKLQPLSLARTQGNPGGSGIQLEFGKNDFAKIRVGEVDFYLSFTSAPPRLKSRPAFERDPFFKKVMASSIALTLLTIIAMFNIHVPQTLEAEQLPERIATILYQPEKVAMRHKPVVVKTAQKSQPTPPAETKPKAEPPKVTKLDIKPNANNEGKPVPQMADYGKKPQGANGAAKDGGAKAQNEAKEGAGARAKGKEGTRGKPGAKPGPEHQVKAQRPSAQGGQGTGGQGNSQIIDEGNVDFLRGAGAKIQNLLGNSAQQLGRGGSKLQGFGAFTTAGSGGLALSGNGQGGGGTADSLGGLTDHGKGGGRVGTGMGAAGNGTGIVGGRARVAIRSGGPEEAIVMGAIDADAVEAALLAHKDEFRLCYEREINAENPRLAGRVGTSFVIGTSGRVNQAGIESTSLKHAAVERCILTVIKRIQFPVPRGGGIVQVTYPFKFAPIR